MFDMNQVVAIAAFVGLTAFALGRALYARQPQVIYMQPVEQEASQKPAPGCLMVLLMVGLIAVILLNI